MRWLIVCIIFVCVLSGCVHNTYKFNTDNGTIQFYGYEIYRNYISTDSIETDGEFLITTRSVWNVYENYGMDEIIIIRHTRTYYESSERQGARGYIVKSRYMVVDRDNINNSNIPAELKDIIRNIMGW